MKLLSKSEAIQAGQIENFASVFSIVPERLRPDQKGLLWPAPLWGRLLHLPFPRPSEFWVEASARGRIGANVSLTDPRRGFIGFYEAFSPEVGKALLSAACQFLKDQGVTEVFGPLNFNTWFPYRFGLPHADTNQFSWEPLVTPHSAELWKAEGFEVAETYHSMGLDGLDEFCAKAKPAYEAALAKGFTFRSLDPEALETKEIPSLYRISMEGFRQNFLFEPLDAKGFAEIYVPAMQKADLSLSYVAVSPEGEDVGFFYGFADQGYLVLKTVAVADKARGHGLSNALTYLQAKAALEKGLTRLITALVKSGAQSESYQKRATPLWKHEYVLLKRTLERP